jgi:hypothetical protein
MLGSHPHTLVKNWRRKKTKRISRAGKQLIAGCGISSDAATFHAANLADRETPTSRFTSASGAAGKRR